MTYFFDPDDRYYILDTRGCVGNCAMWWAPDRKGYTSELNKAGLYTAEQCRGLRETDIPILREIVERHAVRHVRLDRLRDAGHVRSCIARDDYESGRVARARGHERMPPESAGSLTQWLAGWDAEDAREAARSEVSP